MATDLESFGAALDAIRARVEADLGPRDVRHVERVDEVSRWLQTIGRSWVVVSSGPLGFVGGVTCLWLGKQLQATEIGHAALHGAYDRFPEAARFHAATFSWQMPIDEALWTDLHNARHHPHTNIVGKDPGIGTLPVNAVADREHRSKLALAFAIARKALPYYAREYAMLPALAGPLWWKALLGHALSEVLRDVFSAAALYAGHDGDDVAYYPEGTKAGSRAEWYRMQIEATNNFAVPLPVSILCGGLDLHIEHHLFPKLPPHRLREIAPEVRRVCEAHGVAYKIDGWGKTLRKVVRQLRRGVPVTSRSHARAA